MRQNLAFLDLLTGSPATIQNQPNCGTTPFKFGSAASSGFAVTRLIQLTNKHATAYIAFKPHVSTGSPPITASVAGSIGADEGIAVGPGASYFLNLKSDTDLWIVASAASVPIQIVAYDKAVK